MVFDALKSWCSSNGIREEEGYQKNQVKEYCALQYEYDADIFYIFLKATDNTYIQVDFYDINDGFDQGIMITRLENTDGQWNHSIMFDAHRITLDDTVIAKSIIDTHTDYTFLVFNEDLFNKLIAKPNVY